ncbi:MAG: hypothetical protein IPP34_16665 [Bacteroidetes bacterium]|nr:hypothetical protein [Bacteroidota bacterium]
MEHVANWICLFWEAEFIINMITSGQSRVTEKGGVVEDKMVNGCYDSQLFFRYSDYPFKK